MSAPSSSEALHACRELQSARQSGRRHPHQCTCVQGDVVNKAVRIGGNWGLMPFGAIVGSVTPATYVRGLRETFGLYPNEPNFPR